MKIIGKNLKITKSKKEAILRVNALIMQVLYARWQVNECRVQSFMSKEKQRQCCGVD